MKKLLFVCIPVQILVPPNSAVHRPPACNWVTNRQQGTLANTGRSTRQRSAACLACSLLGHLEAMATGCTLQAWTVLSEAFCITAAQRASLLHALYCL